MQKERELGSMTTEKRELYVDARTKIFLMLVMNVVLLNTSSGAVLYYLRLIIGFWPCIMFLTIRKYKMAGAYLAIYTGSHLIMRYGLILTGGPLTILLGFLASMGTRFLPGGMLGVYFFCSTRVNEFVASMERMHISQKVIIPVSDEEAGILPFLFKAGGNPGISLGAANDICCEYGRRFVGIGTYQMPWHGKSQNQYIPMRFWNCRLYAIFSRIVLHRAVSAGYWGCYLK